MYPPDGSIEHPNHWFWEFYYKLGGKEYLSLDARVHKNQKVIADRHGIGQIWDELVERKGVDKDGWSTSRRLFDLTYQCKKYGSPPGGAEGGPWEGLHRFGGLVPVLFGSDIADVTSELRPGTLKGESLLTGDDHIMNATGDVLKVLEDILDGTNESPMIETPIPVSIMYPVVRGVESDIVQDLGNVVERSRQYSQNKTESAKPSICASIGKFLERFHSLISSSREYPDFRVPEPYILPSNRNHCSATKVAAVRDQGRLEQNEFEFGTMLKLKEYQAYCKDPHKKGMLEDLLEATKRPVWRFRSESWGNESGPKESYVRGPFVLNYDSLARHTMCITEDGNKDDVMNVMGFNDLILIPAILHILAAARQNRHIGSKELVEDQVLQHRIEYLAAYHAGKIPFVPKLHGSANVYHGITGRNLSDDGNEDLAATMTVSLIVNSCLAFDKEQIGHTVVRMFRSIDTKVARLTADEFVSCFGKVNR